MKTTKMFTAFRNQLEEMRMKSLKNGENLSITVGGVSIVEDKVLLLGSMDEIIASCTFEEMSEEAHHLMMLANDIEMFRSILQRLLDSNDPAENKRNKLIDATLN